MARFYFHLSSGEDYERDEIGSEHADANQAYLEAFEAAQQLAVDLIREHKSPASHRFDICDERDQVVFRVPFTEIVGQYARPFEVRHTVAHNQKLAGELRDEIISARSELESLWTVLKRI